MIDSDRSSWSNKDIDGYYPITIIKDSNLQLSLLPSVSSQHQYSSPITIAIWKDERLEHLDISRDLIELLQINGFTTERILEYGPSQIAKIIGIDDFFAQIIFNETTTTITKRLLLRFLKQGKDFIVIIF
ncbi:MAG TPA: hypothetical protein VIL14_03435 [Nitrososphaeraceae archaeon]